MCIRDRYDIMTSWQRIKYVFNFLTKSFINGIIISLLIKVYLLREEETW